MSNQMIDAAVKPTKTRNNSTKSNKSSTSSFYNDYLDEYDHYYFEHEKYLQAGHGGKQRTKREVESNTNKHDPSGNVRVIINKMVNFEHNRRK